MRLLAAAICSLVSLATDNSSFAADKPNIVIIMVDDMGFSDIGCYGAETETPHLDSLARNGLRFTQFYNTGRCCPTRAALLTGLYQHQAGIGHMTSNHGYPAYQGYLNDRCLTIAEALKPAGYYTAVSGKWHVGSKADHWPRRRGPRAWACNHGRSRRRRNSPASRRRKCSTSMPLHAAPAERGARSAPRNGKRPGSARHIRPGNS